MTELAAALTRFSDSAEDPTEDMRAAAGRLIKGVGETLPPVLEKMAIAYALVIIHIGRDDQKTLEWMITSMRSFVVGGLAVYYRYHPQEMPK
jgi:hypothetical protein